MPPEDLNEVATEAVSNEDLQITRHSLLSTLIISLISFLISIGCCYFALFSVSFRLGLTKSASKKSYTQNQCLKPLPFKYLISKEYLYPILDLTNTKYAEWTESTVYLLEGSYNFLGIQNNFLLEDEYVIFSVESYSTVIERYLQKIGLSIEEMLPSIALPITLSDYYDAHSWFRSSIYPASSIESYISINPLEFYLSDVSRLTGIETMKRSLVSNNRPLAAAFRLPRCRFWYSCDEDDADPFCEISGEKPISFIPGSSYLISDPKCELEPHDHVVMAIVGYNDNFIARREDGTYEKGGFILRSGTFPFGHTYQYFTNSISQTDEDKICPPFSYTENQTLLCFDERFCDPNETYTFISDSPNFVVNQTINNITYSLEFTNISADYIPTVFRPPNYRNENCGYQFIPYSMVKTLMQNSRGSFAFDAIDMNVIWDDSSYYRSGGSGDYAPLKNATHHYNKLQFE